MIDPYSATWRTVIAIAEQRIEQVRNALERDADEVTTTRLRATLHALRDVLSWPDIGRHEPSEGIDLI